MSNKELRLTGGIVFALILGVVKPQKTIRKLRPEDDPKNETTYFIELLTVLLPDPTPDELKVIESITKDIVSKYKSCQSEGSNKVPFNNSTKRSKLISKVTENYDICLNQMESFISRNLNTNGNNADTSWLMDKLIELLLLDSTVSEDYPLYINKNGKPTKKCEVAKSLNIDFSAFLLGVWLFSCCHPMGNKISKEIYKHIKIIIDNAANNDDKMSNTPPQPSLFKLLTIDENDLPLNPNDTQLLIRFKYGYDDIIDYHINKDINSSGNLEIDMCAQIRFLYEQEWMSPYRRFENPKLDKIRELILAALNTIDQLISDSPYYEFLDDTGCIVPVLNFPIDRDYYQYNFKPTYIKVQKYLKKLKILLNQFVT